MSTRPRIVVTRRWPAAVERVLYEEFDTVLNEHDEPMSRAALEAAMCSADALCITVSDSMDAALLDIVDAKVRLLANFGVGFNHIDLAAAARCGIVVTNTPGVLTECTADLAMTLLLMTARRTGEGERELREGGWTGWRPTHLVGTKVTGKTLGIVGAGRIGLALAHRAKFGFDMKILLAGRSGGAAPAKEFLHSLDAEYCALEDLLKRSDFVSLHCPSSDQTHHLIDAAAFELMPQHAILLNTARGDIVDEAALLAALQCGAIGGAGLDVYEAEPQVPEQLQRLPNVVLLPHLGSSSQETRHAMGMCAVANLRAFFAGETPPDIVQNSRQEH